jgi:hypothetical protein
VMFTFEEIIDTCRTWRGKTSQFETATEFRDRLVYRARDTTDLARV